MSCSVCNSELVPLTMGCDSSDRLSAKKLSLEKHRKCLASRIILKN